MTDNGTLPLTTQVSEAASHNEDKKTYCFKVICQHGIREAGESRWASWRLLFTTRLLYGLTFATLFVLSTVVFRDRSTIIPLGLSAVTFLGLAICTFLQGNGAKASRKSGFSTLVVFLHSATASISVYLIVGFLVIVARGLFYPSLLILLTPLMAYILDVVVLQSRIRLEYRYSLFWSALNLAYTVIALIVLGFSCQNCVHIGYGTPIAVLVLIQILVGYIASIIAVWLTRIPWPCLVKT